MHAFAIQLVDKLEVPFSPRENDADEDDIDSMQWASAEDYHEAKAQRSLKDAQRRVDELQGCRIPSADITLGPVLGKGAFGEVYKARVSPTSSSLRRLGPLPGQGVRREAPA